MKKLLVFMLVLLAGVGTVACTTTTTATTAPTATTTTVTTPVTTEKVIDYESDVSLNVAINYSSGGNFQFITYQQDTSYTSTVNGETYSKNDLLPVWDAIGEKLNITFIDKAVTTDTSTANQWTRQKGLNFVGLDLINGTGATIAAEAIENGTFVDLAAYLNYMPNLKSFLDSNPSVRNSITASDGGIYYTPYFDGFGEQEQMFLMRIDWVEDILDATAPDFDDAAGFVPTAYTRQQMPDSLTTDIVVANADGTTRTVEKSYTSNILDILKALVNPTGTTIANAFRAYMIDTYGDQGYTKLSDVFVGTDAAYDTDELIALMFVIKSNPLYITRELTAPLSSVNIFIPRTKDSNRIQNFVRSMEMFGLRGVFSKCEYLYFDQEGVIQDIRHDQDFLDGLDDLVTMSTDGLIPANLTGTDNWVSTALLNSNAFMMYDYNNTQTQKGNMDKGLLVDPTYSFQCVLPPVVDWLGDGNYFHFTESVRSVKGEAWGVVYDATRSETELFRILKLVDEMYDYSTENSVGTIHLYGPADYTDGTLEYGTDIVYQLSDEALAEMAAKKKAMIDYLRIYVGATMPIGHIRSLGLEYQTLSTDGIEGVERLNTAAKAGVMLLAGNVPDDNAPDVDADNPWFQLSPTTFPLTKYENLDITMIASFRTYFEAADYPTLVAYGFTGNGGTLTQENYWKLWNISQVDVYEEIYIKAYRDAYARLQELIAEAGE